MKKKLYPTLMLTILISLLSLSASSQPATNKVSEAQREEWKKQMEIYKEQLQLTENQQPKFQEIHLEFAEELQRLKKDNASKISKFRKLRAARDDKDRKIKNLLNAEQYRIYQKQQEKMKDQIKTRRKKQ